MKVTVLSCGFQRGLQGGGVVRPGHWTPIKVSLSSQTTQHQEIELRAYARDLDGDWVGYAERPVTVTAGIANREAWCYGVVPNEGGAGSLDTIQVVAPDGALLESAPVSSNELLSNNTQLFVDISEQPLAAFRTLDSGAGQYFSYAFGARTYYRSICVATLADIDVPDRWFGLDAVDVLLWDDPDPARLQPAQVVAIREWVRRGGFLVLGLGPAWASISQSALAELLPLRPGGATVETATLPAYFAAFSRGEGGRFRSPIAITTAALAPGAVSLQSDRLADGAIVHVFARRLFGSGVVVTSAARFVDLTGGNDALGSDGVSIDLRAVFERLLDVHSNRVDFLRREAEVLGFNVTPELPLYSSVMQPVEFRQAAGLLVLFALTFVASYIFLACVGSWLWLVRRGQTSLSWSAFALCGVVGAGLSLGAVSTMRGLRGSVHSSGFVDMEAASTIGRGPVYFGYRSTQRFRADLSLPGEETFLRPLGGSGNVSTYTTPERYVADAGAVRLVSVPMRATLKQFEGFWQGDVGGTVHARVMVSRQSGRLAAESWIRNDLGVQVGGGWLLYLDPRNGGETASRAADADDWSWRAEGKLWNQTDPPPALSVLAVPTPAIDRGATADRLAEELYAAFDRDVTRWRPDPRPEREPWLPTLWSVQTNEWLPQQGLLGGIRQSDPNLGAMFLLSTRNLLLHNRDSAFDSVQAPPDSRGVADHDVSHWLSGTTGVLMLWTDEPGPARLHLDGAPLPHDRGRTVYRVRVPIEYVP